MNNNIATLTICHTIFLTKEERHRLLSGSEVETLASIVPWWIKKETINDPTEESWIYHHLSTDENANLLSFNKESNKFFLKISKQALKTLRDSDNFGTESVYLVVAGKASHNNQEYQSVHYIVIQDYKILKDSLNINYANS